MNEVGRCGCRDCRRGDLIAGHCVDIDGDLWHTCPATDAADAAAYASWSPPFVLDQRRTVIA